MKNNYHFIGIGGIGMSGIAQLLLRRGFVVSGSDLKEGPAINELKALGAEVFIGHHAQNIKDAQAVVYSSVIKEDNPEIIAAKKRKIPLLKRAQALAELMKDKSVITVSGSHGKTTTSSLVSCLLLEAGFSPTLAVGGILRNIESNACLGEGDFFVAEADESDGSFLYYQPKYSIVTNIDREHLDYYHDFAQELAAFRKFLDKTTSDGCIFACSDDLHLKEMLEGHKKRHVSFGLNNDADIYPENIQINGLTSGFDCFFKNKFIGKFQLALGGRHNISNALSVIALGLELQIELRFIKKALSSYQGARRRLEVKFFDSNYLIVDDYAHHPTEIKATLSALADLKKKRMLVIFQPHRFSRTKILLDEFSRSFDLADYLMITDIYPASEPPIEGINAELLCRKIREYTLGKEAHFLPKEEIAGQILKIIRPGDLVITLGAGDIVKISDELAQALKGQSKV